MKKVKIILMLAVFSAAIFVGCKKDSPTPSDGNLTYMADLEVSPHFDFSTVKTVNFDVTVPVDGTVKIMSTDGSQTFTKGSAIDGQFNGNLVVPKTVTEGIVLFGGETINVSFDNSFSATFTNSLKGVMADSDGDGVDDLDDDFPADGTRAYKNWYCTDSVSFYTLAFEDLYPWASDFDYNDIVIWYNVKFVTNQANELYEIMPTFILQARGGSFHSGFGFHHEDIALANVESVTGYVPSSGIAGPSYVEFDAKGYEDPNASYKQTDYTDGELVVIAWEDATDLLEAPQGGVNTSGGYVTPQDTVFMTITLDTTVTPILTYDGGLNELDWSSWNPFIIKNPFNINNIDTTGVGTNDYGGHRQTKGRTCEIHLKGKTPTSFADTAMAHLVHADNSNVVSKDVWTESNGLFYQTENYVPWAMDIAAKYSWTVETDSISEGYLHFLDWAESDGTLYTDWYSNTGAGYRDAASIYSNVPIN